MSNVTEGKNMDYESYCIARDMLNAYEKAAAKYRKKHKTNGIPAKVCARFPYAESVSNELRSAIEVYEFMRDKPEKYFLYIDEKTGRAITWMRETLGAVIFGREYRAVFGDKRQAVTIRAVNGVLYAGTYYKSAGNYARIKALKKQAN